MPTLYHLFTILAKTDEKSRHVGIRLDTHETGRNKGFHQRQIYHCFAPPGNTFGVSENFIPHHKRHKMKEEWFVIRGVFGKAEELHRVLDRCNIRNFYPMRYRKGDIHRKLIPAIPNLCFVYATHEKVFHIIDHLEEHQSLCQYLTPYIDPITHQIMTVPTEQMERFITAFNIMGDQAIWIDPRTANYRKGDRVRIIGGNFKNIEGHIVRCYGQQRVAVEIEGITAIATAYVPTPLLEKIIQP